jgi:hypothetical protein
LTVYPFFYLNLPHLPTTVKGMKRERQIEQAQQQLVIVVGQKLFRLPVMTRAIDADRLALA